MTKENPIILIDTNVWLDYYDGGRAGYRDAISLINKLFSEGANITFAPTSAKDVFYIIAATLKAKEREVEGILTESRASAIQEMAWGCIDNMSEIATVLPIGESQMWIARHYKNMHSDFEDDLLLAAVETCNADYFVTNDVALLGKSSCPAFTCKDMLAFLNR